MTKEDFREISIRGRFAFGAACFESALEHYRIQSNFIDSIVLPIVWDFTITTDLSKWDEDAKIIDPLNYEEGSEPNEQAGHLFKILPQPVVDILSEVILIGTANLYGGTQGYSPLTLEPLESILLTCKKEGIAIPEITAFAKSPITEYHGWGYERNRNFFLKSMSGCI